MGIRAHLRDGRRTNDNGLVLSAADQAKLNQMKDKSTHEKWAPEFVGTHSVQKKAPDANDAQLRSAPAPTREPSPGRAENPEIQDEEKKAAEEAAAAKEKQDAETLVETTDADQVVGDSDDLTLIEGVGDSMQEKLIEAGYATFESIAETGAADLDEAISGISEDSAKGLIKQAKGLAKKKAKGKL